MEECWDTYVVPVGPETLDAIYVLNWSIRSALTFGGHKRGEARNCLDYTKRRINAFAITFGDIPDDWYATGAGAILIEDTPNDRGYARFGRAMEAATLAGKIDGNVPHPVVSKEHWLAKIKASIEAVEGTDCVIIARTESKLELGLDDAIDRCVRAADLGAEMTYVHGLRTLEECEKVNKALPGWKMFGDVATVNGVPFVTLDEIAELGFNLVTMHYLEKGSMYGMMDYGHRVFADHSTGYADAHTMGGLSEEEQKQLLNRDFGWLDAEDRWKDL